MKTRLNPVTHRERRPRSRSAALAILLLALLPVVVASPASAGGPIGASYVALGDSYASGEGLGDYEPGTDQTVRGLLHNTCDRSANAFAMLINLSSLPGATSRAFWACSGATTAEMGEPGVQYGQFGEPPQVNEVVGATRYVSLTAGGDDLDFQPLIQACLKLSVSVSGTAPGSFSLPSKESCTGAVAHATAVIQGPGSLSKTSLTMLLSQLYESILLVPPNEPDAPKKTSWPKKTLAQAHGVTLAVLGYPRIFPSSYPVTAKLGAFCTLNNLFVPIPAIGIVPVEAGMTVHDAEQIDALEVSLNTAISDAVNTANNDPNVQQAGDQVVFADTYDSSVPQRCTGVTPGVTVHSLVLSPWGSSHLGNTALGNRIDSLWTKMVALAGQLIESHISTASFHPTIQGQEMFASVAKEALLSGARAVDGGHWPVTLQGPNDPFAVTVNPADNNVEVHYRNNSGTLISTYTAGGALTWTFEGSSLSTSPVIGDNGDTYLSFAPTGTSDASCDLAAITSSGYRIWETRVTQVPGLPRGSGVCADTTLAPGPDDTVWAAANRLLFPINEGAGFVGKAVLLPDPDKNTDGVNLSAYANGIMAVQGDQLTYLSPTGRPEHTYRAPLPTASWYTAPDGTAVARTFSANCNDGGPRGIVAEYGPQGLRWQYPLPASTMCTDPGPGVLLPNDDFLLNGAAGLTALAGGKVAWSALAPQSNYDLEQVLPEANGDCLATYDGYGGQVVENISPDGKRLGLRNDPVGEGAPYRGIGALLPGILVVQDVSGSAPVLSPEPMSGVSPEYPNYIS